MEVEEKIDRKEKEWAAKIASKRYQSENELHKDWKKTEVQNGS